MERRYSDLLESSSTGVFELPGEPAIVINGLPPLPSSDTVVPSAVTDTQPQKFAGSGEWLVGREIRKQFGDKFFKGKVTLFDKEMGWYTVVYEDGDSEDLEWEELEKVLVPLDVNIPLKSLALKIVKKQKPFQQSAEKKATSRQA